MGPESLGLGSNPTFSDLFFTGPTEGGSSSLPKNAAFVWLSESRGDKSLGLHVGPGKRFGSIPGPARREVACRESARFPFRGRYRLRNLECDDSAYPIDVWIESKVFGSCTPGGVTFVYSSELRGGDAHVGTPVPFRTPKLSTGAP